MHLERSEGRRKKNLKDREEEKEKERVRNTR